jgi:hypothetical protein
VLAKSGESRPAGELIEASCHQRRSPATNIPAKELRIWASINTTT